MVLPFYATNSTFFCLFLFFRPLHTFGVHLWRCTAPEVHEVHEVQHRTHRRCEVKFSTLYIFGVEIACEQRKLSKLKFVLKGLKQQTSIY